MKKKVIYIIIAGMFFTSCLNDKIKQSQDKKNIPVEISLFPGLTIHSTGNVQYKDVDYFPAGIVLEVKGLIIYIDPLLIDSDKSADYIFITHAHADHFSVKDIQKILKKETVIVCPRKVASKLAGYNIKQVKPGEKIDFGKFQVEAIPAYNLKPVFLWIKAHTTGAQNVGYILTIEGKRIYHAGDTDFIKDLESLNNLDVAIIPIGGDGYTMDVEQSLRFIETYKPAATIPIHYDRTGKAILDDFIKGASSKTRILVLE